MVAAILLITLNISMACDWILKWWTVKELSFFSKGIIEVPETMKFDHYRLS